MDSLESVISDVFSYYLDDKSTCSISAGAGSVRLIFTKPKFKGIDSFSKYSNKLDKWTDKIKDINATIEQLKITEDNISITFEEDKDGLYLYFIRKGDDLYIKDGRNLIFIKERLIDKFNLPNNVKISLNTSFNILKFKFKTIEDMRYKDILFDFFKNFNVDDISVLSNNHPFSSSNYDRFVQITLNNRFRYDVK
jgi:hypothetical protein